MQSFVYLTSHLIVDLIPCIGHSKHCARCKILGMTIISLSLFQLLKSLLSRLSVCHYLMRKEVRENSIYSFQE